MRSVIMIGIKTIAPIMILILAGLILYMRRKQQRSIGYILCFSIFYVYLLYVAHYTIFPIRLFDNTLIEHGVNWKAGLNLIPFRELTPVYLLSIQGVGNVLLSVPFGFGLPFITDSNLKSVAWKGLLFFVSIEFLQFLENILNLSGYITRRFDVNDVILNTTGVLLGFALFRMLSWVYHKSVSPKDRVEGVWEHIHTVLTKGK